MELKMLSVDQKMFKILGRVYYNIRGHVNRLVSINEEF